VEEKKSATKTLSKHLTQEQESTPLRKKLWRQRSGGHLGETSSATAIYMRSIGLWSNAKNKFQGGVRSFED